MTRVENTIQILTMKVSKGLEFPVVALPGVGHMPAAGEDEQEAARVFYVATTRATQRLVIGVGGGAGFGQPVTSKLVNECFKELIPGVHVALWFGVNKTRVLLSGY